ncbi:DNA damage-inducible protein 1-like [Camellia sinensis]|uniref:DNA damage-inducible protein 1-like n=1 Tax=Camellia sinensis TaxID=4442 RepID=UPI0010365D6E|nr:DNA damage-inducible protein 1-like [Camellia sinensis]
MKKKETKGSDSESPSENEAQLGSIQLLGSISKKNKKIQEPRSIQKKDVLYVEVKVNGITSHALVDTGATHNFVSTEEAKRLGLKMKEDKGWSKPVNTKAKPIQGVVRSADMTIGSWIGQVEFSVIEMDDHSIILGMDFMRKNNVMLVPHAATMSLFAGDRLCEVPLVAKSQLLKDNEKTLVAMQQIKQHGKGKDEVASTSSNNGQRSYRDVVTQYAST